MPLDLVTWTPAIGGSGSDKYQPPVGTFIAAGGTSFSSVPTIAEINASSHINQIIALYNRRAQQLVGANPTLSTLSYVTTVPSLVGAAAWNSIRTAIINLTTQEFGACPITIGTRSSGSYVKATDIAEYRQALAIPDTITLDGNNSRVSSGLYQRYDNPYNTFQTEQLHNWYWIQQYKWMGKYSGFYAERYRTMLKFPITLYGRTLSSAVFSDGGVVTVWYAGSDYPTTLELWSTDQDESTLSVASFSHFGTYLAGLFTKSSGGDQSFSYSADITAKVSAYDGAVLYLLASTDLERQSLGLACEMWFLFGSPKLVLTFV